MATLVMLRAQFPEANGVSDTLVAAMLQAAAVQMSAAVWGEFGQPGGDMTIADQGQMYLAMHKLALSPFGQNAKLRVDPKKAGFDRTTYGTEFKLLQMSVCSGFRVA